jgi:hypothetical protein
MPLLGYSLQELLVEGQNIEREFLQVHRQPEVGEKAYDIGGKVLSDFFKKCIKDYLEPGLDPIGKKIIETALNDGKVEDYSELIEGEPIIREI